MSDVKVGSTWIEDDKRLREPRPTIHVCAIRDGRAMIRRSNAPERATWAKLERFNKKGGYLPAPELPE